MLNKSATILVCTYNADQELSRLLASIHRLDIPLGWTIDCLIADNANRPETKALVEAQSAAIPVGYLPVPDQGKCKAANAALRQIQNEVIVCTDEDIEVDPNWLKALLSRIENGSNIVTGVIDIEASLKREWMTDRHLEKLAITVKQDTDEPRLIGANMAFRRSVLEKVPAFDEDLGPGHLGCNEDTLFALQLREAGFTIDWAEDARVTHCFKPQRLERETWLKVCYQQGQANAYVDYHWAHKESSAKLLDGLKRKAGYLKRKALGKLRGQVITEYEMDVMYIQGYEHQLKAMKGRPRNYEKRGLRRLNFS